MNTAHRRSLLDTYLRAPRNMLPREQLVESKLLFDLQVSAAKCGYPLLIYRTTTDIDGFDLALDDRLTIRQLQLKATIRRKVECEIHRQLFRPRFDELDIYGFGSRSLESGRGGGVVLIRLAVVNDLVEVEYFYSDFLLLELSFRKVVPVLEKNRRTAIRIRNELRQEQKGTVTFSAGAFVKARTPDHLMALMGLSSSISNNWRVHAYEFIRLDVRKTFLNSEELSEHAFQGSQVNELLNSYL